MANVDLNINVGVTPKNIFENISNQIKSLQGDIQAIGGAFKTAIGAFAAIKAVAGTFDFIIDATRQTEDLTKQFIRFTGSVEEAEKQLEALKNIPGPSLSDLAEANRTLLAFGSSTEESIKQLKQLNDVAAANGAKIDDLADLYGKIQQEGSLTAETFKKLSKEIAGFSSDFAKALGVPEKSLKSLAEQGQISSEQVAAAFQKLTSEGGKYFGAAERQAETLSGSINSLSDNVTDLASEIGQTILPALTEMNRSLAESAGAAAKFLDEGQKFRKLDEAGKEIERVTLNIESLTEKLRNLEEGGLDFDLVFRSRPAVIDETIKRINFLKDQLDTLEKPRRTAAIADEKGKAEAEAAKKAEKEAEKADAIRAAREAKAVDESVKLAEQRGQKLLDIDRQINTLREQQAIVAAEKMRLINEQAARDAMTPISGEAQLALEQQRLLNQQQIEAVTARESAITAQMVEANAQRLEINLQGDEAEKTRLQGKYDELSGIQAKAESDSLAAARKARAEEFNLQKITDQAVKNWEKQTWQERAQMAQAGLSALAGLMQTGSRDAFNIGKRAAQAQILINIPEAAMKAYTSLAAFPPLAFAAAAAATAVGFSQISKLESTRFAEGGMVPGVGNKDTVPALLTPGEVVVPKQNFEDLAQNFAMGSIANDQVQLMTQSNALQSKILEQITQGVLIEKMTIMIGLLEDIKTFSRSGGGSGLDIPVIDPVPAIPPTSVRNSQERVIDYKRVDDRRA